SLGNVIDPNEECAKRGADVLRLWVASVDTSVDVPCDKDILDHVGAAYRRFRNNFKFLLGEIEGQFDPATDAVATEDLLPYDRLMLARMCEVHEQVNEAYRSYHFNAVYRTLYDFVVTELSNGYLNATKDRVYCGGTDSLERRSAQTVWAALLTMLVHDLQPILVYTTDEVMAYLPASMRDGQKYAALLDWYQAPMAADEYQPLLGAYQALIDARAAFTKAYEAALTEGIITEKTTQAAAAHLTLPAETLALLGDDFDLAEVFVCASVEAKAGEELACEVHPASGEKCPRCWNWRELGEDGLCERCHDVMSALEG
ncbi:MAG: class I tRNA ligase family protein, partial [Atopobiaceae bacterium]|nr:class I tRNA ligase family protein [Atopobiaceae bacterium]